MKFHEWETLLDFARKQGVKVNQSEYLEFYSRFIAKVINKGWMDTVTGQLGISRQQQELWWYEATRPYYKVWPAIQKALMGLNLNIPKRSLDFRPRTVLIRFADGAEPAPNAGAILTSVAKCLDIQTKKEGSRVLLIDWGEEMEDTNRSIQILLDDDLTLEQSIKSGFDNAGFSCMSQKDAENIIRCAVMVHLLADDPTIITPDVLSKDTERYATETDEEWKRRAEERARRRGKVGWNIGAEYEVCPHYRRPHFGIRHTGKGRTVPRIVPIKGAVVHRSKLTEVPTGYILPDGTEVEGGKVVAK